MKHDPGFYTPVTVALGAEAIVAVAVFLAIAVSLSGIFG